MKKLFIYFSLFIVHSSFAQTQDTIVLRNGQKMAVHVLFIGYFSEPQDTLVLRNQPANVTSIGYRIFYRISPDTQKMSIRFSKVMYIKYKNGSIYTIHTEPRDRDKTRVKIEPYLVVSAGTSHPWTFSGYGANTYNNNPEDGYGYSGYAYNGTDFSLSGGISIIRGWSVIGMFSYIRNQFDASGIMDETVADFYLNGNGVISINNINAIGNYYYTNYSFLAGINKDWAWHKKVGLGIGIMFGDFITRTPALHGLATGFAMDGYNITQTPASDYFNMNSEKQTNGVTELNFHMNVFVTPHIFIRAQVEFQLTGITNGGGYQIVDVNSGNTVYSGYYSGSDLNSSGFFVGLTDATVGVGYRF